MTKTQDTATETAIPCANEAEDGSSRFRFQFGAYGWTKVDVFADSMDDAFEVAVEWLDDNAPGHLVSIGEAELHAAAEELGLVYLPELAWSTKDQEAIIAHAEQDLTLIGHTQLKNGQYVLSHEWHCDELPK